MLLETIVIFSVMMLFLTLTCIFGGCVGLRENFAEEVGGGDEDADMVAMKATVQREQEGGEEAYNDEPPEEGEEPPAEGYQDEPTEEEPPRRPMEGGEDVVEAFEGDSFAAY